VAAAHPLVAEAAALSREGRRPWLVVVPDHQALRREGFVGLYEALRFHLETASVGLPVGHRPAGLTIARQALPQDPQGGLDRRRLAREVGHPPARVWPAAPPERTPVSRELAMALMPALEGRSPIGPLYLEQDLELDLGLDSLDRLVLILALADAAGMEIDEEQTRSLRTLGDLQRLLDDAGTRPRGPVRPREDLLTAEGRYGRDRRWLLRPARLSWVPLALARPWVQLWLRWRLRLSHGPTGDVDWRHRPLMLVANHQSHADSLLIALSVPAAVHRNLFFLGFSGYFAAGWGAWAARLFRIQPVSADDRIQTSLTLACHALEAGRILCIYPEGERTWTGALQRFRRGPAWIARRTGALSIPVAVTGAYQFWPRGWPRGRSRGLRVDFGEAVPPPAPGSGRHGDAVYLQEVREKIAELMRRAGADPERGDPQVFARGPHDA
ncbi:MAG: 1-acyl-sn-glycerol-3-phosphate acyltransferase, partial [Acidobacteriota bacterium]|nr:1-acyl-sn-glycerol-3-phosphate acyltransferase [Acidobacteriota bacterium]